MKMAKKKFKKLRVPGRFYSLSPEKQKFTTHIQQKKTGRMAGRKIVSSKAQSDNTRVLRMKQNADIDRDGKIDLRTGQIIGRTSLKVKPKSVEIGRHYRKTKAKLVKVKRHTRRA